MINVDDTERRQVQHDSFLLVTLTIALLGLGLTIPISRQQRSDAPRWHAEKINPNNATLGNIIRLPGIGVTRAQAILAHREQRPFRSLEDLQRVRGLGPVIVGRLAPWVEFSRGADDVCDDPTSEQKRLEAGSNSNRIAAGNPRNADR